MKLKTLLVIGVGPATGSTLCRLLSGKYRLIMVARSAERINQLASELEDAHAFPCDVADQAAYAKTLEQIKGQFGVPERILVNTESAPWGAYNQLSLDDFAASFEVNAVAFLQLIQVLFPDKAQIKPDTRVLVSSSPGAYTPPPTFLGLAPSRVAQRVMAELLQENLESFGLKFSVFSIDGAIDEPKMRAAYSDKPIEFFIQQEDICKEMERLFEAPSFPLVSGISGLSSFAKR